MYNSRKFSNVTLLAVGALMIVACGGGSDAADADPCDAALEVTEAFDAGDNATSAEDVLAASGALADALTEFAKVAPDDFSADAELLADGMRRLSQADPETGPSEELIAILDGAEFNDAGDRLEEYVGETCGLEFG